MAACNDGGVLAALARAIAAHPVRVIGIWVVVATLGYALALGVVGPGLFDELKTTEPSVAGEAMTGRDLLVEASPTGPTAQLLVDGVDPADPRVAEVLGRARPGLDAIPNVGVVADPTMFAPTDPRATALLSTDGRGLLVTVSLRPGLSADTEMDALERAGEALTEVGRQIQAVDPDATAMVGSGHSVSRAITDQVEDDLRTGESVALPVSLFVMVFVFGGFIAAGLPVLGAIASIAGGLAALMGFAYLFDLDAIVVNVVSVMGLGLCIDYGLLMVSRFREELADPTGARSPHWRPDRELMTRALVATVDTAGRTVAFSGLTVAISLAGLLLMPARVLRSVAAAGVSVVLVAVLVAITLVPALLAVSAGRLVRAGALSRVPGLRAVVARFGDVPPADGVFSSLARAVQRRAWLVLVSVLTVLVVLSLPAWQLSVRSSALEMLPTDSPQRVFYETLHRQYPMTRQAQVQVVFRGDSPAVAADADEWARGVTTVDGVLSVDPALILDGCTVLNVHTVDDDQDRGAEVVRQLRRLRPHHDALVTGQAAMLVDFTEGTTAAAPAVVATIVLATYLLLFLMTGSVLIPLKALLMNVASLGATLGVVVWGFQYGYLEGLLDFTSPGGIETVIPAMVLALGFGLSMDYEVFLLARIKEHVDAGLPSDEAVVRGLQQSGRIITSAAIIIVVVFIGFSTGKLLAIKETGVALAVAVAIDASLVRMLLVPATMTLLGRWNWWAPAPLRALHDRIGLRH